MPASEWRPRFEKLAAEMLAACEAALRPAELRLDDAARTMWAEEEDPQVAPHWPIGEFFSFRLRERRTHNLFGRRWLPIRYWGALLEFGAEEMWASPYWTTKHGVWCVVRHEGLVEIARGRLNRFCAAHRLTLAFSGTRKDP